MLVALAPRPASYPVLPDSEDLDRHELIGWAEPVIADRMLEIYSRVARGYAATLAVQHRRMWRKALLERHADLSDARKALAKLAASAGLSDDVCDAVDQDVIEELLEIVLARHRASRATAKRLSLILLSVATCLEVSRVSA